MEKNEEKTMEEKVKQKRRQIWDIRERTDCYLKKKKDKEKQRLFRNVDLKKKQNSKVT